MRSVTIVVPRSGSRGGRSHALAHLRSAHHGVQVQPLGKRLENAKCADERNMRVGPAFAQSVSCAGGRTPPAPERSSVMGTPRVNTARRAPAPKPAARAGAAAGRAGANAGRAAARARPAAKAKAAARGTDAARRGVAISRGNREIDSIARVKDPAVRNLQITQKYGELARDTRNVIGADGGANWAAWATWASKQAGVTIRQEDLGTAGRFAARALGGIAGRTYMDSVSAQIAGGNKAVFAEIGKEFSRFNETFRGDTKFDQAKLDGYLGGFRRGSVKKGGQDLLRQAFTNYHSAKFEKDVDKKKELMFLGNAQIGQHEQTRLQPYIEGAMAWGTRGLTTEMMMKLKVPNGRGGMENLALGSDVPKFNGRNAPQALGWLDNPTARNLVKTLDANPWSLQGSGSDNWVDFGDRMNYIVDLFRSRHDNAGVYDAPFTKKQTNAIKWGNVPDGDL